MKKNAAGVGMTSERTRKRMVERLRDQGIRDERVLAAMAAVPRHLFVEEALASRAYEDTALPIGFGQTISQPYVVARMTEVLIENQSPKKLLEVGTGCGYQAAVLAHGDGYAGLEGAAPFQSIIVAAAAQRMPEALLRQLAPGGRMVLPLAQVGKAGGGQRLVLVERNGRGFLESELDAVRFVPMEAGKA